jgi:hypothetical protein
MEQTCLESGLSANPVAPKTHSLSLALPSSELTSEMPDSNGSSPNQTTKSLPVSSASEPGPAAREANPLAWATERAEEARDLSNSRVRGERGGGTAVGWAKLWERRTRDDWVSEGKDRLHTRRKETEYRVLRVRMGAQRERRRG